MSRIADAHKKFGNGRLSFDWNHDHFIGVYGALKRDLSLGLKYSFLTQGPKHELGKRYKKTANYDSHCNTYFVI